MAKKNKCEGKPAEIHVAIHDTDTLIAAFCCEKHAKEAAKPGQSVVLQ